MVKGGEEPKMMKKDMPNAASYGQSGTLRQAVKRARAAALERLQHRLLASRLAEAGSRQTAAVLRRAAAEAGALAWTTRYPFLLLPELLNEKTAQSLAYVTQQEKVRAKSKKLLSLAE